MVAMKSFTSFILFSLLGLSLFAQTESLSVFDAHRGAGRPWLSYQQLDMAWYNWIQDQSDHFLEKRKKRIAAIESVEAFKSYQEEVRNKLYRAIGGLPEKTPLDAEVVGKIEKANYTVEKVLFESQAGYFVSSALFIPKSLQQPAPAILYVSGHTQNGFRSETYQHVILNLVEKGFIVYAFDPIGQGERFQYVDKDTGQSSIGGPTKEHSYPGAQALMTGTNTARYMINDGIRAIDYLVSRPEVDASRIGITGRSGGGTQSAYIAAFDQRIKAVAPENYITSFKRLLQSIGPQDAEQNLFEGIKMGIDHADLLIAHAPKACLLLGTTHDYFSIQGLRETYQELKRLYRLAGDENDIRLVEDVYGHGSTKKNRERMYAFFQYYLENPGEAVDREVPILSEEELTLSESGQLLSTYGSKGIFDLNMEEAASYQLSRGGEDPGPTLVNEWLTKAGISLEGALGSAVFTGKLMRKGYVIEKYFLERPEKYPVPFFLVRNPAKTQQALALFLSTKGKEKAMAVGGEIEQLVKAGYTVLAPDLLNVGELASTDFGGDAQINGVSYNMLFASNLIGSSLVALQVEDLRGLMNFAKKQKEIKTDFVMAMADGYLGIPLLHYALLDKSLQRMLIRDGLISWSSLVNTKYYQAQWIQGIVPGALTAYDLPDIIGLLAPRSISLLNPLDASGERAASGPQVYGYRKTGKYENTSESFESLGAYGNFQIIFQDHPFSIQQMLRQKLIKP